MGEIDWLWPGHMFGRPHGAYYYEQIMEIAAKTPEIWVGTRAQIANYVLASSSLGVD